MGTVFLSVIQDGSFAMLDDDVQMSKTAFHSASEYRFYHTDTLFALIKPIHKTPLPMITLTISVKLLEGR